MEPFDFLKNETNILFIDFAIFCFVNKNELKLFNADKKADLEFNSIEDWFKI